MHLCKEKQLFYANMSMLHLTIMIYYEIKAVVSEYVALMLTFGDLIVL